MQQPTQPINPEQKIPETPVSQMDAALAYIKQLSADLAALEQLGTLGNTWAKELLTLAKLEAKQSFISIGKLLSLHLLALFLACVFYISLVVCSVIAAKDLGYSLLQACGFSLLLQIVSMGLLLIMRQRNKRKIGFHYTRQEVQQAFNTVNALLKNASSGVNDNE